MRVPSVLLLLAVPVILSACSRPDTASPSGVASEPALTIERVAALPSVIGTSPSALSWSPDGTTLAFLWNEQGWPFRDVYLVGADGTGRRRLTDLQATDPAPSPPVDASTEALQARASARARTGVSEIAWDGSDAVILVHRGRAFRAQVAAGAGPPVAVALDPGVSDLALSPDRSRLAFLRDGDLWTSDRDGHGATRLTVIGVNGIGTVPLGTYNRADREVGTGVWGADWPPFAWSPDGTRIAFHAVDRRHIRRVPFPSYLGKETVVSELRRGYPGEENERRTLHVVTVATRAVRDLGLPEPGRRAVSDFSWSPSGRLLVDHVSDTGAQRWLYVVEPGSSTLRQVWHDRRDSRVYPAYVARWHWDGRRILTVADLEERDRLYAIDPDATTSAPMPLSPAEWDVAGERGAATVQVVPAAKAVFVTGTGEGPYERHVYRVTGEGVPARLTSSAGVHVPAVSPDGRVLATIWSDDTTPPELLLGPATATATPAPASTRVTISPLDEFRQHAFPRPRYATFTNAVDGFVVHARILEPPTLDRTRRHPVVFGPVYSNTVRNRWGGMTGTLQHLLVQRGYIVVQVDVRGSVGYGRAFREAFLMDYGGKDLDDLQAVVDGLAALPYVDRTRMGIWGSSYGGLLSAFALLKRPGLFAAGVAGAPALDPYAFGPDDVAITRAPDTHPEAFVRGSAMQLGQDLQDHLLIIHGMMDDVVPFRTTMALAERLMLLGKDFDVATAPAATHAWAAREHYATYFYRKLVQHFDRYLAASPAGPPAS